MHMPVWGTLATITASERGIQRGDDFEILLGGDGSDPAFTQIPEEVKTVSLREYYLDWRAEEPAVFTIECLDDVPAPARLTGEQVVAKLDVAIQQVERSVLHWNAYMNEHRAKGVDNTFSVPMKVAKGLGVARYSFNFWSLAADEVLLIESDVPEARYWNLQLANIGWFEQIDSIHRITTINQKQAHVSSGGRLHMVIAHEDPGVPNWFDTGGHHQGLITYRWFWPQSDPAMASRVVKLSELASLLPEDTPMVDAEARRRDVSARKAHLAWRFRT